MNIRIADRQMETRIMVALFKESFKDADLKAKCILEGIQDLDIHEAYIADANGDPWKITSRPGRKKYRHLTVKKIDRESGDIVLYIDTELSANMWHKLFTF